MDEVRLLLTEWKLPQLCTVFEEQEVTIRALKYLTKDDITELIPKMGPRSIFCAKLKQWIKQNDCEAKSESKKRRHSVAFSESNSSECSEVVEIKIEHSPTQCSSQELLNVLHSSEATTANQVSTLVPMTSRLLNDDYNNEQEDEVSMDNYEFEGQEELNKNHDEPLNVFELLTGSFDGRKAISFYKINTRLDNNHRRRIVNVIIGAAIEKKIRMTIKFIQNLTKQILKIFPNENDEAYFIPRDGNTSPKGALYNKYLNMSRQLRKDGLLEYQTRRGQPRLSTFK